MSSTAEQIKERLGIADVIGSYIKVDRAGSNYKARCPFHNEKTPSFFISPGRGSYYCFGCGAKGDIFTFVQEFEKVDFIGALKILAERAGIELRQFRSKDKDETDRLRDILEQATRFYESNLKGEPRAYLLGRGLTEKTAEEWRLGYAMNEWRALSDHLRAKGISAADMEKVGLVKKPDQAETSHAQGHLSSSHYDRFRARVMFPLFDPSDRVVGYSGRLFGVPDSDGPKYLNSPETPLFNKSEFLYGYNKAKDGIREWKYAILVEGQMDLLMCHQAGFTNTVATSGTSISTAHLEKLKRISDNLMIVYDADRAGLKATLRAWTAALSLGMDIKIAGLPEGEDPASLILQNKEKFKDVLKHSKHVIEYYLDILVREYKEKEEKEGRQQGKDGERKLWKTVAAEMAPFLAAIPSAVDAGHFMSRINLLTGISEDDLREELKLYKKERHERQAKEASTPAAGGEISPNGRGLQNIRHDAPQENVIDRLIGIILMLNSNSKQTVPTDILGETIALRIRDILKEHDPTLIGRFEALLKDAPPQLIFEAEIMHAGSNHLGRDIEDLYIELEERLLKERFGKVMNDLQRAEKTGDQEKALLLLTQCKEISLSLSALRRKKSDQEKQLQQ